MSKVSTKTTRTVFICSLPSFNAVLRIAIIFRCLPAHTAYGGLPVALVLVIPIVDFFMIGVLCSVGIPHAGQKRLC